MKLETLYFFQDSAEMEKHRISKEAEASGYRPTDIMYGIDDKPPWYLSLVLGMQHYLTMIGSTVSIPFIICPALCIEKDDPARGETRCLELGSNCRSSL